MLSTMRVMVVEDDGRIAVPLVDGLRRHGFTPTRVTTGAQALAAADTDVVLLDLGLPDLDGIEVCRRLRARSGVLILVITARGEETDRVLGLEFGADDYLVKPFGFRELVARIRAVQRRVAGPPAAESDEQQLGAPGHLEQILGNLLANAVEASPPGHGIEVGVTESDSAVTVHVRDHGTGLSEQERQRAFDRFWQSGATPTVPAASGSPSCDSWRPPMARRSPLKGPTAAVSMPFSACRGHERPRELDSAPTGCTAFLPALCLRCNTS
jgi:DNA-binding response OmpR family regulator